MVILLNDIFSPFRNKIEIVELDVRRSPPLAHRLYSQLQPMNLAVGRMGEMWLEP